MRKNTNEIDIIKSLIDKHIENLRREDVSKQDKEIDYILVEEAVEALIREYKNPGDSRILKNKIKKTIIAVYEDVYAYLIKINKYDHRMLDIYTMLENFLGNSIY